MKKKILPYIAAYSARALIRLLLFTCKINVKGIENMISQAGRSPCIVMLWHNRLIVLAEILSKYAPQFTYTAFISKSRDGDPLARYAESYRQGRALRVPHNGRHLALGSMISQLKLDKNNIILITPDGPRGPKYVMKPGIIMAAREAEAHITPFSWEADRFWELNTWDKMRIPKPFSTITVTFADPIAPSAIKEGSCEDAAKSLERMISKRHH